MDIRLPPLTRYDDVDAARPRIEACLAAHAFAPEHTYECFRYQAGKDDQPVFFESPEGYGVLAYVSAKRREWEVFAEPLAPREARGALVAAVCVRAFSDERPVSLVSLELTTPTRTALIAALPEGLRARRAAATYEWPILDLAAYDPTVPGGRCKPLRNARSRFLREHAFEVVDAAGVPAKALHRVVDAWEQERSALDQAHKEQYHRLIDAQFAGTTGGHACLVDGVPEGLFAGWQVPGADAFYPYILLHSYAHWGLGELVMLEALRTMKEDGYRFAELGGSDRPLLAFKKKFGPLRSYEVRWFSVSRREAE
ncbi:MAG: GNAT family N-acetyltransferase [Patescibacteria group bacterium]|nr:GNAT family N-acetyltransferase [Patescibacteria group bacterium]